MNAAEKIIEQAKKKNDLTESFLRYFTVKLAAAPEQIESVYKIRYHVYCEEFGSKSND